VILYRVLVAASLLGGAYLTYRLPNGPLLFWWLFSALVFGSWVAFSLEVTGLGPRARRLVLLYCLLVSAALISTQLAARRLTTATHVLFQGVLFERADSVVIASGQADVDVVLPTLSPAQSPWRLAVLRDSAGWRFGEGAAVEQVRVSPVPEAQPASFVDRAVGMATRARRTAVLNGVVLDDPGDRVVVRDPSGRALDTLALDPSEGGSQLRSTRGTYRLSPDDSRLRTRYQRMLRFGTPLGSLDGSRAGPAAFDRFVRVQRLSVRESVNGHAAGWLDWLAASTPLGALLPAPPTRLLLTAAAPFELDGGAVPGAPLSFADSVQVEVRHLGGVWRFDLVEMRREATAERGLSVRFVRNPRPLDSPLPSGDSCTPGVACGLLSLRRLPMPVAHIALDAAGLDPSRFALLARLEDSGDGVKVVLPRDSVMMPLRGEEAEQPVAIPVVDLRTLGSPPRRVGDPLPASQWVLMSASSNYVDDAGVLALVCLGVTGLLLLLAQLVGASAGRQALVESPREGFLALGLNAVLALLLARLIIGARVTFFSPYLPAGLDTAIGMWVAIAVVTLGLISWSVWAPPSLKLARALVLQRSVRWSTLSVAARAAFGTQPRPEGPRRIGRALLLVLSLALLAWASLPAVAFGLVCGLAVLSTWFTIAWTAAFSASTFHSFESGPFEVIEYQGDNSPRGSRLLDQLPERDVILLTFYWALAVWQPGAGVLAALAVSAGRIIAASRPDKRSRADGGLAELMPVLLAQVVSTVGIAILAGLSANGALAAFVLVILVALVGVRAGRALAARISQKVPGWMMVLYLVAPLLLLLPLAVIDMGLLLVMVIPLGVASLLAVGLHRLTRGWQLASAGFGFALLFVLFAKVLFPDVDALRSDDPVVRAERFEQMQEVFGLRLPVVGASFDRAAARAVAARDQRVPSIEQAWASRAYSAAGWRGVGLGAAPIGRGIAESVSYAENSYAVYVLHEHGVFGGVAVLLAYFTFATAVMLVVRATPAPTESLRASRAMFLVAVLVVTIPAVYVALSNVGVVPITGQNMPFLGLNAWSDVTLCAGVVGILITGAIRTESGTRSRVPAERAPVREAEVPAGVAS
jgi:hypothetical protein